MKCPTCPACDKQMKTDKDVCICPSCGAMYIPAGVEGVYANGSVIGINKKIKQTKQ